MSTPSGSDDDRRETSPGRRVRDARTLEALVIQLDDNMRRDMKESHDRLRRSIDEVAQQVAQIGKGFEPRIRKAEDDILKMETAKTLEDKNYAKQSTFIAIFVSAAMTGIVKAFGSYFAGKP